MIPDINAQEMIYLDHNATTPLKPAVREIMQQMLGFTGNASSIHKAGRVARQRIEESRNQIARLVNAGPKAVIIFTSGATEANNLVLKGSGCERILVSAIEHPSVSNALSHKEIIPVLPTGLIDLAALDRMLESNDRSTLISIMTVHNETGIIQPIDQVVKIARHRGALVHTDAVQAAGRLPLDLQSGVDYLTLSSHKIGGPQGAGCLILSNCVFVTPLISGGPQEKNLRAGTENLAAIAGFGKAAELAAMDISAFQKLAVLRDQIETALEKIAPGTRFFGKDVPRVANTTMFSIAGMPSETQIIALDLAGICVSNGSACASGTVKSSADAVRVSLGWNSTEKDVECFVQKWTEIYDRIQSRKK